jgi:hypothetical protein
MLPLCFGCPWSEGSEGSRWRSHEVVFRSSCSEILWIPTTIFYLILFNPLKPSGYYTQVVTLNSLIFSIPYIFVFRLSVLKTSVVFHNCIHQLVLLISAFSVRYVLNLDVLPRSRAWFRLQQSMGLRGAPICEEPRKACCISDLV